MSAVLPAVLVLVCPALGSGPERAALEAATHHAQLANGLHLIVCEKATTAGSGAAIQVYADAGTAYETPGIGGVSQVLRYLFHLQAKAAGWTAARGNARLDAQTAFLQEIDPARIPEYLRFEASRLARPDFALFEEARKLALAEKKKMDASWILDDVRRVAMSAHPVGSPPYGYDGDLERLSPADAEAFWRRHFVASNLIVTVVGPVKFGEVRRAVEESLGRLPRSPKPEPIRAVEPVQRAERRIVAPWSGRGAVLMAFHKAGVADPSYPVWDVLLPVLSERLKARLTTGTPRLAERVHAGLDLAGMKYPGLFSVLAFVPAGTDPATTEAAIRAELQRLSNEKCTDAELAAAKKGLDWSGAGPNHHLAADLADWQAMTGDYREIYRHPERVAQVTAEQVRQLASRSFVSQNGAVALAFP